jgi:hypothetical protein
MTLNKEFFVSPSAGKRRRVAAYVLLAAAGLFGFWRQEQLSNELDKEARDRIQNVQQEARGRSVEICEANNKVREAVLKLVEQSSGGTSQIDPNTISDPQLRDLLLQSQERSKAFRAEAAILLALQNCEALP